MILFGVIIGRSVVDSKESACILDPLDTDHSPYNWVDQAFHLLVVVAQ